MGLAVIGALTLAVLPGSSVVEVRLPARHMGVAAATMLLERIAGDAQPARTVVFRAEIAGTTTRAARRRMGTTTDRT